MNRAVVASSAVMEVEIVPLSPHWRFEKATDAGLARLPCRTAEAVNVMVFCRHQVSTDSG